MRRSPESHFWFRFALAVVVLSANVGAPFNTSAFGRTILAGPGRHAATSPVLRVRVTTQAGASHGFRAVVGFSAGGPGVAGVGPNTRPFSAFLPSPIDTPSCPRSPRPPVRASSPLRC